MEFNLLQTSGIIAITLTILLALYFLQTRKEKVGNNIYLSGILAVYAVLILCSLILSSGINKNLFRLAHIANQSIFLVGPMLYFYIDSYFNAHKSIPKKAYIHSLPYIAASIYLTIKLYFIHLPITCRSNHILLGSIAFAHTFIYFFFTAKAIRNKAQPLKDATPKTETVSVKWPMYFVFGCFSILLIKMLFFIVWDVSGYYNGCNEIVNLYFMTSFVLLNVFIYFLLLKPQFLQEIKKYKHSVLKNNEKEIYKNQLLALLENDKIYRNPLLSLNFLSKKLSIPSRYLSQIINETLDKSYYELINWYRIQECMEQLADTNNSDKTILEIAYDVGFNSKSTFNSSFIKYAGTTPKEFRKKHQSVSSNEFEMMHN